MKSLSVLLLALCAACSLDLSHKRACTAQSDCNPGYQCAMNTCVRSHANQGDGDGDGDLDGGTGSNDAGAYDGGARDEKLALWLRADMGVLDRDRNPAPDGELVRVWQDQSMNGFDAEQFFDDYKPTYSATGGPNGQPAILFDGGFKHFTLGANYIYSRPNASGMEFYLVIRSTKDLVEDHKVDPGHLGDSMVLSFGSGGNYDYALFYDLLNIGLRASIKQTDYLFHGQASHWVIATYEVHFKSDIRVRINGEEVGGKEAKPVIKLTADEINEAPTREKEAGPVTIGGQSKTDNDDYRFLTGGIAEILIFDDELGPLDRDAVECELSKKYGIALNRYHAVCK
jgi:hypothetical protein